MEEYVFFHREEENNRSAERVGRNYVLENYLWPKKINSRCMSEMDYLKDVEQQPKPEGKFETGTILI